MNANFAGISTAINGILSSTLTVSGGGTGLSTIPAGAVLLGNSTSAVSPVAAGTSGNVLVDNGAVWSSQSWNATTTLRSCATGNSNDVMVPVGSWCVDKYQASVWSVTGGTGSVYVSSSYDMSGAGYAGYAVSKPNVQPATTITWFQAIVACANSGKQLIPDAVWQMSAMGTVMPASTGSSVGSASNGAAAACNINGGALRSTAMAGATWVSGSAVSCISQFGVQDMIGNLWEWTDMLMQAGPTQTSFVAGATQNPGTVGSGTGNTWNLNGSSIGQFNGAASAVVNGAPAAAIRGGDYGTGVYAGVFALALNAGPSFWSANLGFRCARPR